MTETSIDIERHENPYDYWRRIGSPQKVVAPMVDQSDLAYRMMTRKYGADLVYTQMFNANAFVSSKECRDQLFEIESQDRPLFVQIAGHCPQTMLKAALYVQDHCDAIDINLGCPQGIARRGRYGAFMMDEVDLLYEIVSTMVKGLKVPVTCKTRIYKDYDRTIKLLETLARAGASVLTVHGRTREEKGKMVCHADWHTIKRIKEHFAARHIPIPIIANGGIECVDDIYRCIAETGVDGVMTSEAILENPSLFTRNLDSKGRFRYQIDLAEEYLTFVERYPVYHNKVVRSHMMKMLFRYINVHVELRDLCSHAIRMEEFKSIVQRCRELIEEQPNGEAAYPITWYNRYRYNQETGTILDRQPVTDPNQLFDLKSSFMNSFQQDGLWSTGEDGGEDCGECGGGIFDALNLFGSPEN